MHTVTTMDLHTFITDTVMLAGGILAGAEVHTFFAGSIDLLQKFILQCVSGFAVTTEKASMAWISVSLKSIFIIEPPWYFLPVYQAYDGCATIK